MDSLALDLVLEPSLNRTFIRSILAGGNPEALIGKKLIVGGWVKMGREQGKGSFAFMELNDESCGVNLQVIVDGNVFPLDQLTATSTCVLIKGELKKPPEGTKQDVGMRAERVIHIGPTHPRKYLLPKTRLTLKFLCDFVHLRPRTNTLGAYSNLMKDQPVIAMILSGIKNYPLVCRDGPLS